MLSYATSWKTTALSFASHVSTITVSNVGVERLGTDASAAYIAAASHVKIVSVTHVENTAIMESKTRLKKLMMMMQALQAMEVSILGTGWNLTMT
jgi:hypothetical protein